MTASQLSLQQLREDQRNYTPSNAVAKCLKDKTVLLFIGPAGVGKSTTLNTVHHMDARFSRTGSVGTRDVDPRDTSGLYTQLSTDTLIDKIEKREVVQYAVHPTTDTIYATTTDMYRTPYTMLEALPVGIAQFRHPPFGGVHIFYIVTEAEAWASWFNARYSRGTPERNKRLQEAIDSLSWSLKQPRGTIRWLINIPSHSQQVAQDIIDTVLYNKNTEDASYLAEEMLKKANEMLT